MSEHSEIEWTDATWNPVRGCTKITPGCDHCYAETFAERFRGVKGHPYEQGFDLRLVSEKLAEPLRWKTPKMIFVNSMSDLFHKDVPDDYVEAVGRVMERANWHTYQVLTKRSSRLRNMLQTRLQFAAGIPNVWWGVSVEDQAHGLVRIKHLQQAPAAVRFLSVEPLLEDLGEINLEGIHWVIVGGESGAGTGQCGRNGCCRFGISASEPRSRSSSSSGAASIRARLAENSTAKDTTASPTERSCRPWRTPSAWRQSPSSTGFTNPRRLHPNSLYSQSRRRRATSGLCPTSLASLDRGR